MAGEGEGWGEGYQGGEWPGGHGQELMDENGSRWAPS